MPNLYSLDWNKQLGSCVKHGVPMTPCPAYLAEKSPDITVSLTESDIILLDREPGMTVVDLFPVGQEFLADRII